MAPSSSILGRKRDLVYLVFFVVHLVVMFAFDFTTFYPDWLQPAWQKAVVKWYYETHGDRFFSPTHTPPPWFTLYALLELTFHVPLTLWAIPALLNNHPRLPLALLVYGLETSVTTLTCLAEVWSWSELTPLQRGVQGLGGMYGSYLALGVFMSLDCWFRLDGILSRQKGIAPVSKKEA